MLSFPGCKINLGLHITQKRADGFHDVETVFYPIPLCDALEIVESEELVFECNGISIPDGGGANIVLKAYHLLKNDFSDLPAISISLLKKIPIGAGLGGGSSDGAEMLKMLNIFFQLNITEEKLSEYASQLGSDCSFFVKNIPALAKGRGEILEPVTLDLSKYHFVIVKPDIHIATAWAFSQIKPKPVSLPLSEIMKQPIENWKEVLRNDFEEPIFKVYPRIEENKTKLYALGALYSSMSGSGSAVYGIFDTRQNADSLQEEFKNAFVWSS